MDIQELSQWTNKQVFAKTGKHLDSLQKAILEGILQHPNFTKIANTNGYSYDHIRKEGAKLWKILSDVFQEDIKQSNVKSILENKASSTIYNYGNSSQIISSQIKENHITICNKKNQSLENRKSRSNSPQTENKFLIIDLTEAPEINYNYERDLEINTIKEWLENKTRLLTIYGLKGIGKTAIILKLISEINTEFDYIIYKTLENKPKLINLKDSLKQVFSQKELTTEIIDYLKHFRCLVILDDLENLFKTEQLAGQYLSEYEDYGQFFEQIATKNHQSCLILISQEKSPDIDILENQNNYVKTLQLKGLGESAKEIFQEKEFKYEEKWEELINLY
ncbi:NB-ARC domain-containing protein [Geminocystis sp. GBBB08]|uniref:NB-ARC domain-containing protein n=1 Tax=Geminocystis sp. GBBB08 TaxID=2604140 RepID=UPI0027E354BD|nr:NB-ARC domain-containing protein [Geminocystis sp. GBBB08]